MSRRGSSTVALRRLVRISFVGVSLALASRASAAERPNVLLILADDFGYECLSSSGSLTYRTPAIDRLAAEGARFTNAHAQPLCTPTRVKLLTGMSNARNYVRFGLLDETQVTLAMHLRTAGYRTAIAGKWQLGGDAKTVERLGFDRHCLWHLDGRESRYWEPRIVEDGVLRPDLAERYGPDVFCEFLEAFIESSRDEPFFAYYPMALTHWPFVPTPRSPAGSSRERRGRYDGQAGGLEYFDDMVAYTDECVGRLLKKLETLGLRERTLVVFTGDNGTATNVVSRSRIAGVDVDVRGGKGLMTDAGTHVPLVASWPGVVGPGIVSDALVDVGDLFPTIAEACGAPVPGGLAIDGVSFLPQLRGAPGSAREFLVCHYDPRPPKRGGKVRDESVPRGERKLGRWVRDARHKLYDDGRLYDLARDPSESTPVPAASDEARGVRSRLEAVHATLPAWTGFGQHEGWERHVVVSDVAARTAVAGDLTGDGRADIVSNVDRITTLYVAPDWTPIPMDGEELDIIHAEIFDVDGDGDLDFIGARYSPGHIVWYETPVDPARGPWRRHLVDDRVDGVHGLLRGDVDRDGRVDLLATSGQPRGEFPNSLVWYEVPDDPRAPWERHVFANRDAPGLSHYLGFGDIDGDGHPDAASAAKGGPSAPAGTGDWFAWWRAPEDPSGPWTKHIVAEAQLGATNIHPVDVDRDGEMDFIASRGHGRGVVWFQGPDWTERTIHPTLAGAHCLTVADLDGDGDTDAATCAKDDRLAVWFENDGAGRFTPHLVGRDQAAYDIRATDIDGDGDLDLLVGGQESRNVVWYANPVRTPEGSESIRTDD